MRDRHRPRRSPFWYLRRDPARVGADVDEEIETHLDMRAGELRAAGLPADAARREAMRQFGDLEYTRRYCRQQDLDKEKHMLRGLMLDDVVQDVRIARRGLWRVPAMTLTIVATVGLGIGATTVIFSAVYAALVRPLPYPGAERLVRIYTDTPPFVFRFSVVDYLALQAEQTRFEQVAGYTDRAMSFSDGTAAERLRGRAVSWTYFDLLRIRPVLGRDFTAIDTRPGSPPTVIVAHRFWQQRLGARADVIGRSIRLEGLAYQVIGVLPPDVGPLEQRQEFFVAAQWAPPRRKGPFFITTLARLRPGVTPAAAADELRAINRRLFPIWKSSYQDDKSTWGIMPLKTHVTGEVGTIAALALAAVALVWLIACTNASNLLIARVASRRQELAVRAALGASRARLVRYLLVESALLAGAAAALGCVLAWTGIGLLRQFGVGYFPRTHEIALDAPVLWLLAGLALTSAALFGLIPALHASGGPIDQVLRALGRSATHGPAARRVRRLLVASQFAIATPLLVGAGLLLASLSALRHVDPGFDSRNMLSGSIQLPATYEEGARVSFWDELARRLEGLPGVSDLAFADGRPPTEVGNFNNFDLEELPTPSGQSQPVTAWVRVTPDYFRVLGLPLIEGRLLEERDARTDAVESVVVDRAWARRFFPNGSAVGKRFREGGCTDCPWTQVVGVVSDVKYAGLDKPDEGTVYWPLTPDSDSRYLVVRTGADPAVVLADVRRVVRELDPDLPLSGLATFDELMAQSLETPRLLSLLVGSFALVALVLSIVGIYGVMAYYVQQHLKDIGIRLALGGSAGDVLRLIVGHGMQVVVGGVVVGLLAALLATRLMSNLLFGVGATDAFTFGAVTLLLTGVAAVACVVPAWRAIGLQPSVVLRE